jgi:uncharacterized protein
MGLGQLKFATGYTSYFSERDLRFKQFQAFQGEFAQNDQLVVILESKQNEDIKTHLPFIEHIIAELTALPFVKTVGGFDQRHFDTLFSALPITNKPHPALKEFVAADNSAVLLTLSFNHAASGSQFLADLQSVRTFISEYIAKNDADFNAYYSGELALNWQYADIIKHDLIWFLPALVFLLCVMLWLVIPERWWIVGMAASSFITLICTLGLAGWMHFTMAAISGLVPVIIIVLNVSYSMHLYFDWRNNCVRERNLKRKQRCSNELLQAMQGNVTPLFWGSITTAFGFILLRFSPSPPIQDFGAMVAFAVLLSFLVNYSVLISFARLAGYNATAMSRLSRWGQSVNELAWRFRRPMLMVVGILTLVASMSVSQLRFNDDAANYFPSDNPFSVSKQVMEKKFNGINQVSFVVNANRPLGITEAVHIKNINQFSRFLRQQDEVLSIKNLVDWLKWSRIGQTQLKQILTDNTPQALGVEKLINVDSSASLIRVNLVPMKANELIEFENKIIGYLQENGLQTIISTPLSQQLTFAHLSRDNAWTMLSSFIAALFLLLILFIFLKRSFKLALLGLFTNLIPLVLVFGFWQFIGGSLSLGCAVVMGMILGIIIDDSLHLLLKVHEPKTSSVDLTFAGFGVVTPAITFTSILLVCGFSLGLNSDFYPIVELSFLSLLTIFIAWLFDFIVLPVCYRLIIRGERL